MIKLPTRFNRNPSAMGGREPLPGRAAVGPVPIHLMLTLDPARWSRE
jgi:hypothetical protein